MNPPRRGEIHLGELLTVLAKLQPGDAATARAIAASLGFGLFAPDIATSTKESERIYDRGQQSARRQTRRKLILGSKRIPSRQDYKFAMLRAEFALLIAFVATFYDVLDIVNGMYSFLPWYGFMFTVAIVALVGNRRGRYTAASLFILTTINLIIFIFADADHPQGGVYFFFMSTSVADSSCSATAR